MDNLTLNDFQMYMLLKTDWQQEEAGDGLLFRDYTWTNQKTGARLAILYRDDDPDGNVTIELTRRVEGSNRMHSITLSSYELVLEIIP